MSRASGVAIVGLACRFPGAPDADAFWRNLVAGVESVTFFTDDELRRAGVAPSDLQDPAYVKAAPVLANAEAFDAAFFGYSPREARLMDPQQRIFLEVAWSALEDAGLAPDDHDGVTGCFAGTGGVVTSWLVAHQAEHPDLAGATGSLAHLGNDKDFVATRASYRMDLRGPSINVQTACSTSLVALHLACRSVLDGECDLALAGASTVRFPQVAGYRMEKGDILSPDGHCRAFDAGAQGTIFGSGAGVVVLKPLEDALADGDPIHAVVKATALNNDGRDKVSFTASSVPGQVRAMVEALALAGVPADSIGFVECHGTGTVVGDPLEVQALSRAFRATTKKRRFCAIGSVKTNVGHLEQAAGMASLIKTALALSHGVVPPSLNFEAPNPRIDFRRSPFFVATEVGEWPVAGLRRAAVNSLGLGGTNAFAVLEEAPPREDAESPAAEVGLHVVAVDAVTDVAVEDLAVRYADALPSLPLAEACWTSLAGRSRGSRRITVAGEGTEALVAGLRAAAAGRADPTVRRSVVGPRADRPMAFLFTGQGAQRPGMGRALYAASSVFRAAVDEVAEAVRPVLARPLLDVLFAAAGADAARALDRTEWTQPCLFALQVGLAAQWRAWGVVPDVVLGHSVGAFAAATVAGALDVGDAARLVARRAVAMGALPPGGAMAAVFADAEAVASETAALRVEAAVLNGPGAVVLSGDEDAVLAACAALEVRGTPSRRLTVSHAFHSHRMEPALAAIREAADDTSPRAPALRWISDTTGAPVEGPVDADYWVGEGRAVDWAGFYGGPRRRARLPTYPFARTVHGLGPARARPGGAGVDTGHPLLGRRLRSSLDAVQFEARYSLEDLEYLRDHRMYGMAVLPTTVALEVARAAATLHFSTEAVAIEDLVHEEAMVLPEEGARVVHAIVEPRGADRAAFRWVSTAEAGPEDWRVHLRATMVRERAVSAPAPWDEAVDARSPRLLAIDPFYRALRGHGLEYGPAFRRIEELRAGRETLVASVRAGPVGSGPLHPSVVDACLHAYALLAESGPPGSDWAPTPPAWLPISVRRYRVFGAADGPVRARLRRTKAPDGADGTLVLDLFIHVEGGAPLAELGGLTLRRLTEETLRPRRRDDVRDWLVRVAWRAVGDLLGADASRPAADPGRWLVLGDPGGPAGAIAEALAARGQEASVLPLGPLECAPRAALQAWATEPGPPCRGVVHAAANVPERPDAGWGWSLVRLIQDLSELRVHTGTGLRTWGVTRGVWAAAPGDVPSAPQGAGLWGVGRAAALEVPGLWGGLIDLPDHADPVEAEARRSDDAAAVVDELFTDDREDQVALRGGRRWAARLERLPADVPLRPSPVVRGDRTYLVTGGLGFLGRQIVRRLVERGARSVAITSRGGETEATTAALADLRAGGARITVYRADVAREADVAGVLAAIACDLPPPAGVFHCAGMLDDGVITRLTEEQYRRVTAPKVLGALHLDRLTRTLDLDHFVLFSSILSLIGSAGQANYTAGNAVLDALASTRRARGLAATSMNWGPWADAGLATESGARGEAIWRARGTRYLPLEGGLEVFDRLLDRDLDHCGVTATEWEVFLRQWDPPPRLYDAFVEEVGPRRRSTTAAAIAALRTRLEDAAPNQRRPLIVELVRLQIMQTLEITEPIDVDRPISEFGLDSLMSVSLVNRLETLLGIPVPVVKLLAGPTVVELVGSLFPDLPDAPAPVEAPAVARAAPASADPARAPDPPRSRWLVTLNPSPAPRLRLFCFPFAGGGSAVFRGWVEHLPPDIELVAVEPPGRLHRIRERPIRTMRAFLDGVVPAIEPLLDRPYACFGHCLGGLTMFETARELRRRHAPPPRALFASGSRPPDRVNRRGPFEERLARMLGRAPRFNVFLNPYEQPDEVFADVIRQFDIEVSEALLESAELRALMLPAVRAEFEMTARYRYRDERPFAFPITCFSGRDDLYVSRRDSMRWGRFTDGDFRLFTREGAHFLMVEDRSFLVDTIRAQLDAASA